MRRFTRLTKWLLEELENLEHTVALHYMHHNFCRIHQTLRVTQQWKQGLAIMFGAWREYRFTKAVARLIYLFAMSPKAIAKDAIRIATTAGLEQGRN